MGDIKLSNIYSRIIDKKFVLMYPDNKK